MNPKDLKAVFTVWLACTVNPKILADIQSTGGTTIPLIAKRTGMAESVVASLVATTTSIPHTQVLQSAASIFAPFVQPVYPIGTACDSIGAILDAMYPTT